MRSNRVCAKLQFVAWLWLVVAALAGCAPQPAANAPVMDFVGVSGGCGDVFVYRSNAARSEYITVTIDARALDLNGSPVTVDLAARPEVASARIEVYSDSVEKLGENPYCNDVGPTAVPHAVWAATGGTVTVTAPAGAQTAPCAGEPYQASVRLENLVFGLDGATVQLPALRFEDVTVGWCAG